MKTEEFTFKIYKDTEAEKFSYYPAISFYSKFTRLYGHEHHFAFACHAAFPAAVTLDLLYRIWSNFQPPQTYYPNSKIPYEAVSDLILSSLFEEVRPGLYEMDPLIKSYLLDNLLEHPAYGENRLIELGIFLFRYTSQHFTQDHEQSLLQSQIITALAYLSPIAAAQESYDLLKKSTEASLKNEAYRISKLNLTLESQLSKYPRLFNVFKAWVLSYEGENEEAKRLIKENKLPQDLANLSLSFQDLIMPMNVMEKLDISLRSTESVTRKSTHKKANGSAKSTEIKITFFHVGYGDTIAIEWEEGGEKKVGFIDSNRYKGGNPLIEYCKIHSIKEIEFFLLSHPHLDHFSGLLELFEFCFLEDIPIKRFLHTSEFSRKFLFGSVGNPYARVLLSKIFHQVHKLTLDSSKEFSGVFISDNFKDLRLSKSLKLKILAPSYSDFLQFKNYLSNFQNDNTKKLYSNNPEANVLSSIVQLVFNEERYILFTSDGEQATLDRVLDNHESLLHQKLILAQVPAHGAKKNFSYNFWESLNKEDSTPAIISSSVDYKGYPDISVVENLMKMGYNVMVTHKAYNDFPSQSFTDLSALTELNDPSIHKESSSYEESHVAGIVVTLNEKGELKECGYKTWGQIKSHAFPS